MTKGKSRLSNEINASSMADIAFLLLIFFLVTTTIDVDKGILHKLPPWSDEPPPPPDPANQRNVFEVLVNAGDQLLVENEWAKVDKLRERAKEFLNNRGRNPNLSDNPQKAIISLQNDRGTSYGMYIQVQNELKAAYREVREEYAFQKFGKKFSELNEEQSKQVREEYPMKLSIAEPKEIGG